MQIKYLLDEDFVNYKKCSMFIGLPYCTFKCDKENGCQLCQNMPLTKQPNIELSIEKIYERYINNDLTKAIVLGGLEPLDSLSDVVSLIGYFRENGCNDDFVIYTGYTEEEVNNQFSEIFRFNHLIIKFGRFRPDQKAHYDKVLGVSLISDNQYAKEF